jgi:hypothetical protein
VRALSPFAWSLLVALSSGLCAAFAPDDVSRFVFLAIAVLAGAQTLGGVTG